MHAIVLAMALVTVGDCPTCGCYTNGPGFYCPNHSPRVSCFRKPCAGCSANQCQSCNVPLPGMSTAYNYRIQFDYPWSQKPMIPPPWAMTGETFEARRAKHRELKTAATSMPSKAKANNTARVQ